MSFECTQNIHGKFWNFFFDELFIEVGFLVFRRMLSFQHSSSICYFDCSNHFPREWESWISIETVILTMRTEIQSKQLSNFINILVFQFSHISPHKVSHQYTSFLVILGRWQIKISSSWISFVIYDNFSSWLPRKKMKKPILGMKYLSVINGALVRRMIEGT